MNQKEIVQLLAKAKENSQKRNFSQTYDLIVTMHGIDLKRTDQQIDFYANITHGRGKKVKVCAFVAGELKEEAERVCDKTIVSDDFEKFADKKLAKKLAEEYDFFIAQANIMGKVAQSFGKVFGPRGKMPNPKVGCVVPPKTNLQPLYDKLQKTVRIQIKKGMMAQIPVGNENMKDEELIENIKTIYDQLIHHLPAEKNNVKHIILKTTMGKPAKIGEE